MVSLDFEEVPIYDNLHGFVKITTAEKEIIDSLYFQRLRDIKQLSFAYYVFPGAVHTRFSHSLGVLSTLSKILDRLQQSGDGLNKEEILKLRMAALLHDIGHYPLSHLIEESYKESQKRTINSLSAEDEEGGVEDAHLKAQISAFPQFLDPATVDGHHERLGAFLIQNTDFSDGITSILKGNGFSDSDIEDIALIIQGKSTTTWFNQIIHSEMDVDRLDYLLRDSHATGVHYGNFDFDYLISNCRLVNDSSSGNLIFCVKSSAVFTVEHFLLARYFWYAQIINERTIAIFDHLGKIVFSWLIENNKAHNYVDILVASQKPMEFIKFNDSYFWNHLNWIIEDDEAKTLPNYEFYKEAAELLIKRKPLKRVKIPIVKELKYKQVGCNHFDECKSVSGCKKVQGCPKSQPDDRDIESRLDDLTKSAKKQLQERGLNPDWIISLYKSSAVSKLSSSRTADEKERDPIRILEKDATIKMLEDQNHSFVKMLTEYELVQPRIYTKEGWENEITL